MTDTEQKALALALDMAARAAGSSDWKSAEQCASPLARASMRAHAVTIERHEADKKAFSDAAAKAIAALDCGRLTEPDKILSPFILPEPEPDPLVDALLETFPRANGAEGMAIDLRKALAARGYKIERIEQ